MSRFRCSEIFIVFVRSFRGDKSAENDQAFMNAYPSCEDGICQLQLAILKAQQSQNRAKTRKSKKGVGHK